MYLLDSVICIQLLGGNQAIMKRLGTLNEPIALNVIISGELVYGSHNSERVTDNIAAVMLLQECVAEIYGIDEETSWIYGRIKAEMMKRFGPRDKQKRRSFRFESLGIFDNDLWIAATSIQYELTLITRDKGFLRLQGIKNFNAHIYVFLIFFFSIFDAIVVSISAVILSAILGISANFLDILVISVTTFALGAIISMIFTFTLTFWIYNRKGDPDVYVYPIMSSINDILITVIFFGACQLYRPWETNLQLYLGLPIILLVIVGIVFYFVKFGNRDYVKSSIKQSLPTLTITNLIASGTGSMLASVQLMLLQFPIFLIFYPAMISTVGGQGAILANTTSTKLHLGTIKPTFTFFKSKSFLSSFGSIFTAGLFLSLLYSILGPLISPGEISFSKYGLFLLVLILSNAVGFLIIGVLATSSAFITYRFGLDPDNLVNPILSSSADLVMTWLLILSFRIFF